MMQNLRIQHPFFILQRVKASLSETNICVHLERVVNATRSNDYPALVEDLLYHSENVRIIIPFLDRAVSISLYLGFVRFTYK